MTLHNFPNNTVQKFTKRERDVATTPLARMSFTARLIDQIGTDEMVLVDGHTETESLTVALLKAHHHLQRLIWFWYTWGLLYCSFLCYVYYGGQQNIQYRPMS